MTQQQLNKYWIAFFVAIALILALSWCAHAEEYMVVSYGVATHHTHYHHYGSSGRHPGDERRRQSHLRSRISLAAAVTIPFPRPNPLDAPRSGRHDMEAELLKLMMFGTLAHVR
jgi:hypothetical protein